MVLAISRPVWRALWTAALLACFALAPAEAANHRLSVTFISPGKTGEAFWDLVAQTMTAAGKQLDIEVEVLRSERNFRRMQALGQDVVNRPTKPDYLILVNEEGAGFPIAEAANAARIKTLFISSPPSAEQIAKSGQPRVGLPYLVGSIVPDLKSAGGRMMEHLAAETRRLGRRSPDGKFHILALIGDSRTPVAVDRNTGMLEAARNDP